MLVNKKIVYGKIVKSSQLWGQLSLRGPKGRAANDGIHQHITNSGFEDGDDFVMIPKEEYERLCERAYELEDLCR